jgi:3-mercaptopyruvate sulfurtransferase SseA
VALALRRRGVTRVKPLEGGFPGWRERGFPVEPLLPGEALAGSGSTTPAD